MPSKLKVVILDDNEADCDHVGYLLEQIETWDIEPICFTTVGPCLDYLAEAPEALLILDYRMDPQDGLEILRSLRNDGDSRPVIVLTGLGDERTAAELGRAGADEYLAKHNLGEERLKRAIATAREHYQIRLQRARLAAQHQESRKMDAIGVLAGGLAHDFNNMLASIMGFADLASLKYERQQDIDRELDFVKRGCSQMSDLVQQLVRFSTRNEPDMVRLNLNEVLQDTTAVLRHSIAKGISIVLDLPQEKIQVVANAGMLQQSLLNLAINAADAMETRGTLTLRARTFIAENEFLADHPTLEEGPHLAISVSDTGGGIPEDIQHQIFEPFFTTKPLSSNKGVGLGLATVWHNVKAHHGDLKVESELGKGSTFTLYLPLDLESTQTEVSEPGLTSSPKEARLLVVDDEELVVEMAAALLEEMGYKVCLATSGKSALDHFKDQHERLSAVILDISMPDMDGREVFQEFQEINAEVPVLFATGHDVDKLSDALHELGAAGLIQKPFIYDELARKVAQVLNKGDANA